MAKHGSTAAGAVGAGAGDVFIGVRVPVIRKLAKDFKGLPLPELECLLHAPIHEERLAALVILVMQAAKADAKIRKAPQENKWSPTPMTICSGPR